MLGECRREVLANGLRVLGVENPALHSFVCSVYVRVGSWFESPQRMGLSHFVEHMLMQGSRDFPSSRDIMRSIEDVGGALEAATYPEWIKVVFDVHRKHWRRAMEIAADVMMRPLFDADEVENEKRIIAQELLPRRDRAGRNISAAELTYGLMFRQQPDEAGTRGATAVMETFTRDMIRRHYERYFVPENMVVCVAGGLDFDEVLGCLEGTFGAMPAAGSAPQPPRASPVRGLRRSICRMTEALPQVQVIISHPAYAFGDPRSHVSHALSRLLGGGLSSRLFMRVREELGLVYHIESYSHVYSEAGAMETFLSVGADNLVAAVEATLDVVQHARSEGFTQAEMERYKESVRCGIEILCDHPEAVTDWFGKQELLIEPDQIISFEEYIRRQEALAPDQLRDVLCEILDGGANLVVVGPYGEAERDGVQRAFPAEEVVPLPVGAGPPQDDPHGDLTNDVGEAT